MAASAHRIHRLARLCFAISCLVWTNAVITLTGFLPLVPTLPRRSAHASCGALVSSPLWRAVHAMQNIPRMALPRLRPAPTSKGAGTAGLDWLSEQCKLHVAKGGYDSSPMNLMVEVLDTLEASAEAGHSGAQTMDALSNMLGPGAEDLIMPILTKKQALLEQWAEFRDAEGTEVSVDGEPRDAQGRPLPTAEEVAKGKEYFEWQFRADDRPVVLFDDLCKFCQAPLMGTRELDEEEKVLRFVPLQSKLGGFLLNYCGRNRKDFSSIIVLKADGTIMTDAEAAVFVGKNVGGLMGGASEVLSWIPEGARDFVFNAVSENRHKLGR